MTKFEELQQTHQRLLDRLNEVADKAVFVREVQAYVTQVCEQAVDVPAPHDRDQLRANLRHWASYLYDATGTYPDTTLRPARPVVAESPESTAFTPPAAPAPSSPASAQAVPPPASTAPRSPAAFGWRTGLIVIIVAILLGVMYIWARANPQTSTVSGSRPEAVIVQPNITNLSQAPALAWRVVTAGPSPFNSNIWVARIALSATGGDGEYIFWVNGQRLPDTSSNQFTVESQGCQPISQFIGVTSGGQSARQELVVQPPEPNSCSK